MSTFARSTREIRWRRRGISERDRVILVMIGFAVAMGLILLGAYLRAREPSAPSADFGVSMKKAGPVRVGVRAPGTAPLGQNAVESIFSPLPLSSPARGDKTILQGIAEAIAEKLPGRVQTHLGTFARGAHA